MHKPLPAIHTMFRAVFWVILPCKMIVNRRFRGAYCLQSLMMEAVHTSETSVDNNFTRPEDSSEHHTRRRENLKSQFTQFLLGPSESVKEGFYCISLKQLKIWLTDWLCITAWRFNIADTDTVSWGHAEGSVQFSTCLTKCFISYTVRAMHTLSLTSRVQHRLKVFENRVLRRILGPKRDEVTGERRMLHNKELHILYSSPNIIR
jgi:hypothetical protein